MDTSYQHCSQTCSLSNSTHGSWRHLLLIFGVFLGLRGSDIFRILLPFRRDLWHWDLLLMFTHPEGLGKVCFQEGAAPWSHSASHRLSLKPEETPWRTGRAPQQQRQLLWNFWFSSSDLWAWEDLVLDFRLLQRFGRMIWRQDPHKSTPQGNGFLNLKFAVL